MHIKTRLRLGVTARQAQGKGALHARGVPGRVAAVGVAQADRAAAGRFIAGGSHMRFKARSTDALTTGSTELQRCLRAHGIPGRIAAATSKRSAAAFKAEERCGGDAADVPLNIAAEGIDRAHLTAAGEIGA